MRHYIAVLIVVAAAGTVSAQHLFNRGPFGAEAPADERDRLGITNPAVKKFEGLRYFSIEFEEAHTGLFHRPGENLPREKTAELVEFSEKIKVHIQEYKDVAEKFDGLGAPKYAALARQFAGIWQARLPVFNEEVNFQKAEQRIEDEMRGEGPEVEERRRLAQEAREKEIQTRVFQGLGVLAIGLLIFWALFSRRRKKKKKKKKKPKPGSPPASGPPPTSSPPTPTP